MKRVKQLKTLLSHTVLSGMILAPTLSHSAISLDRTRVIFNGDTKSISIALKNKNSHLPYLAQSWIENSKSEKISEPFVVLPPLQRIEPGQGSQVRIEAIENKIQQLPKDRESLFYFNLREIPPKSDKPNVLQIALQSKIKMFYRPKEISLSSNEITNNPWQEKLILVKKEDFVVIENPTPFYTTILNISTSKDAKIDKNFESIMIPPFSEVKSSVSSKKMSNNPTVTYINDYGATPKINFSCQSNICKFIKE